MQEILIWLWHLTGKLIIILKGFIQKPFVQILRMIIPLLEKTMLWFKENAMPKERLGKAIDRLGIEKFEHDVFSDELLNRREEILAK